MPLRLALLVVLLSASFYAIVAFAPTLLHGKCGGLPLSLWVGLGIFAAGATLGLLYALLPSDFPPPSPPSASSPSPEKSLK